MATAFKESCILYSLCLNLFLINGQLSVTFICQLNENDLHFDIDDFFFAGAKENEVAIMNGLSVNIHLLMVSVSWTLPLSSDYSIYFKQGTTTAVNCV